MLESGFIGFLVAVPCKVREWMIKESHFDRRTHFVVLGKTPPALYLIVLFCTYHEKFHGVYASLHYLDPWGIFILL